MGILIITDLENLEVFLEQLLTDENNDNYEDYYCISIEPLKCRGCGTYLCYMSLGEDHNILIWPTKDDEMILKVAEKLKRDKLDPHIIQFSLIFGPFITWEEAVEYGWVESLIS